jgi:hypothetical protein
VLADNFNGENGGVGVTNYFGFANWSVSGGSVDLIGNGFFDFLPGNGLYVDMDGSTGNAGVMTSSATFGPGSYVLTFDLAGNWRNGETETVRVSYGATFTDFSLPQFAPFTPFSIPFVAAAPFQLSFEGFGGDNIGMLLDDVQLEQLDAIPEPGTLMLLGSGLSALVLRRRRKA